MEAAGNVKPCEGTSSYTWSHSPSFYQALYAYLECPLQPYSTLIMVLLGIIFTLIGYLKSQQQN